MNKSEKEGKKFAVIHGRVPRANIRGRKASPVCLPGVIFTARRGHVARYNRCGAFSPLLPSSSSSFFARSYFKVMPRRSCIETSAIAVGRPPYCPFLQSARWPRIEPRLRGGRGGGVIIYTEKVYARARHAIMETNVRRSIIYWKLGSGRVGNLSSLATRFRNQSLNKNQANLLSSRTSVRIAFDRVQALPRFPRAKR